MSQAAPQLENGYTRLANELLDALLSARLTSRQWSVVLAIVRKTYGYNKKEDDLSASQIGAMCATNRVHVTETLNQLARMNIINKRPGVHGSIISIQKDSKLWIDDPKVDNGAPKAATKRVSENHYIYRVTLPETGEFYLGVRSCKCHPNQDRYVGSGNWVATVNKSLLVKDVLEIFATRQEADQAEITLIRQHVGNPLMRNSMCYEATATRTKDVNVDSICTSTESVQGVQEHDEGSTESVQVDRTESVHTKDNLPKDNLQKTKPKDTCAPQAMRDRFERFYAAYPKKKSRQAAEKAFAKLNPDEQLLADMIAGIERAMKSGDWADPQFIPYPATWLNAGGWMDEVKTEYTEAERAVIQAFNESLGEQLGTMDDRIFVPSRAAAIDAFMTYSDKPDFAPKFFTWVRKNCDMPPMVGFDYLVSREGFTKVKGGQFNKIGEAA